jgi:signal transduction histidine kinase
LFEMLEAGRLGALNSRGEELVKVAERNGTRMMTLINDLLDIEKNSALAL